MKWTSSMSMICSRATAQLAWYNKMKDSRQLSVLFRHTGLVKKVSMQDKSHMYSKEDADVRSS